MQRRRNPTKKRCDNLCYMPQQCGSKEIITNVFFRRFDDQKKMQQQNPGRSDLDFKKQPVFNTTLSPHHLHMHPDHNYANIFQ